MLKSAFHIAESWLRIEYILYAFWSMFWGLNGLDKFLLPQRMADGSLVGWFGTAHREEQMINYFKILELPEWIALTTLYFFAVLEIIIGLMFLVVLVRPKIDRVVHRLAFKLSIFVFFAFCAGDILFGDRKELWEHGTFMILALVTWHLYVVRAHVRREVIGSAELIAQVDANADGHIATVEYDAFLQQRLAARLKAERDTPDDSEG